MRSVATNRSRIPRSLAGPWLVGACALIMGADVTAGDTPTPAMTRSARGGAWSAAATWEDGRVPGAGARVQVRTGHEVIYDVASDEVIRSIHVAGRLVFAR